MKKIKNFIRKNKYLLLTSLVTLLMIAFIFVINDIYPFGGNPFSIYEFDSEYGPVYYKLWDILHGESSIIMDWNLGSGLNVFGSLVYNSLFLPSSLMIGLFSRSFIPYAMSYIIILKMLFVTICTYIAFDKMFPDVKGIYKMLFTINYAFCGWTSFMLYNAAYLDVFALFPLLVYAFYRLVKENKWGMYIIILTLCLLLNYYISYLILLFILICTLLVLFILKIKEKKKKVLEVFLFTLLSIGLSSVLVLPSLVQSLNSVKMKSGLDNPIPYLGETFLKIVYMAPMVVPFVLTGKQLFVKKDRRLNIFFGLLLLFLLLSIALPFINNIWHVGAYNGFPFKQAFIPSLVLTIISLYYLNNNYNENTKNNKINLIVSIILILLVGILGFVYREEYIGKSFIYYVSKYTQLFCVLMLFLLSIGATIIILKNDTKKVGVLLSLLVIINCSIYMYYFTVNVDIKDNTSLRVEEFIKNYKVPKDGYNFVDRTNELNVNFPYIANIPSMQNQLQIINKEERDFAINLGYGGYDTYILSNGGNIFTNLLMQNKYYLTYEQLDNRLYKLIDKKDNKYLYESKYNLNYIIPYTGSIFNEDTTLIPENTNLIYKNLFNKKDNIMELVEKEKNTKLSKNKIYYIYCELGYISNLVPEDKIVYEESYQSYDMFITEIVVNDNLKVDLTKYEEIMIYSIDINKYINFVDSINDYEVTTKINGNDKVYNYNAIKDTSLLIPVNYNDSLIVKVNDKEVDYKLNVYNMITINVSKGDNKIEISCIPKYLKEGFIITIGSIIVLSIIVITNKKYKYFN